MCQTKTEQKKIKKTKLVRTIFNKSNARGRESKESQVGERKWNVNT